MAIRVHTHTGILIAKPMVLSKFLSARVNYKYTKRYTAKKSKVTKAGGNIL